MTSIQPAPAIATRLRRITDRANVSSYGTSMAGSTVRVAVIAP